MPFLRDTARAVSNEVLLASLEHRAINYDNLKRSLIVNTVRDPTKITGMQSAIVAELDNAMQDIGLEPGARASITPMTRRQSYDKTPTYDRGRVTQYEAERRREQVAREYGHDRPRLVLQRGADLLGDLFGLAADGVELAPADEADLGHIGPAQLKSTTHVRGRSDNFRIGTPAR